VSTRITDDIEVNWILWNWYKSTGSLQGECL